MFVHKFLFKSYKKMSAKPKLRQPFTVPSTPFDLNDQLIVYPVYTLVTGTTPATPVITLPGVAIPGTLIEVTNQLATNATVVTVLGTLPNGGVTLPAGISAGYIYAQNDWYRV